MTISRHYVLAAGGTGGHLIPAFALGQELINRGHHVALITDARGAKIPGCPDKMATHILPAGRITKNPASWIPGIKAIAKGRIMARRLYENFAPSAVVGFGGYPAFPALLGAFAEKIPAIIHEQNAVLGRVNRFTARRVNAIATSYPDILRLSPRHAGKVHLVGNPVREEVLDLRDQPYPPLLADGIFRVLVTGGSQGATVLSDVVPDGLSMLPLNLRRRLQVTQQCRAEDIDAVRAAYATHDIPAELATYLPDLPQRLGWAHMVISRAGASTIAELTCAGRPAILVPLPSATDDHQSYNVKEMVHAGGARAIAQPSFTAVELAKQIQKITLEPGALENAAKAAKNCGRPNAVADLADLVESFGRAPIMHGIKSKPQPSGAFSPSPALATEIAS
ncbi:MAG: undecaprenyldiphospho-muramoylpentapeptide beta-N-acetylglucosaminyltransferase [Sphingorhabdus sp.]|uniref:undecaprenyldiphospho-muramoylpentapeptide beta-N-acetylglucosaminyltransferase n=1 Tax=Sphingorhabdus sp. TaxID=1902408 RepID=UPI0025DB112F|nr:undecaprenyldiphospho-muramoylpentapeptide beta-N-acetylglucosaminyltransferase [Sphingorhabdus sp.]MCO4091682.1 undecaprenyldiphospho-muramoylpentapeptide beta-N-acetylglucosaminyltransferase [Sphingorhabdus sp.]